MLHECYNFSRPHASCRFQFIYRLVRHYANQIFCYRYVWTHATDGSASQLRIFSVTNHHTGLKELGTIIPGTELGAVKTLQYVPGINTNSIQLQDSYEPLRDDLVWVGTESKRIIIYSAHDPDRGRELGSAVLPTEILSMQFHAEAVWVGLASGTLAVFRRNVFNLAWDLTSPQLIDLGSQDPVLSLLPIGGAHSLGGLYAACGKRVWVIDVNTNETVRSFVVQPRGLEAQNSGTAPASAMFVHQMAQSGVGLWLSLRHSATICLYHTETFRHLQDINIASNVSRVLAARDVSRPQRSIHVTALMASRGVLWVGTNVGIALTVPLPRLEGVPIISGRANISYHAHFGSVTFFLNLQHKVLTTEVQQQPTVLMENSSMIREESEKDLQLEEEELADEEEKASLKKKFSDSILPPPAALLKEEAATKTTVASQTLPGGTKLRHRNSSPILRRRPQNQNSAASNMSRRSSKTLPRGFSLANAAGDSLDCDVFGLYGELLNVRDYDCDSGERISNCCEDIRKSDPELSTIPYRYYYIKLRLFPIIFGFNGSIFLCSQGFNFG
jgi:Rho guanine nucleotide exchange factor 10